MLRPAVANPARGNPAHCAVGSAAQTGQTVVQLLAGLVIGGILVAVAVVFYGQHQQDRADQEAAAALVRGAEPAVQAFYADNGTYKGMTLVNLILRDPNMPLASSPNRPRLLDVLPQGHDPRQDSLEGEPRWGHRGDQACRVHGKSRPDGVGRSRVAAAVVASANVGRAASGEARARRFPATRIVPHPSRQARPALLCSAEIGHIVRPFGEERGDFGCREPFTESLEQRRGRPWRRCHLERRVEVRDDHVIRKRRLPAARVETPTVGLEHNRGCGEAHRPVRGRVLALRSIGVPAAVRDSARCR